MKYPQKSHDPEPSAEAAAAGETAEGPGASIPPGPPGPSEAGTTFTASSPSRWACRRAPAVSVSPFIFTPKTPGELGIGGSSSTSGDSGSPSFSAILSILVAIASKPIATKSSGGTPETDSKDTLNAAG